MKRTIEKTVLTGFIVLLGLLGIVGVVFRRTVLGLVEDSRWVSHSHELIHLLDRLSFQIAQSEDAARGYVITQDASFLTSYRQLRDGLPSLLAELRRDTTDNSQEQQSIARLQSVIEQRFALLDQGLAVRQTQGIAGSVRFGQEHHTKELSQQIAGEIQQMKDLENRLLSERDLRENQSARRADAVVIAAVLLAMIAVAFSVILVFRDLRRRQEVERMKAEFVSIVSHELRTPLTSIRGSLGLLGSGLLGASSAKSGQMLEIAIRNTDRLIRLLNDVLEIEKLQSGKFRLRRVSCDAGELMKQAAEEMSALAHGQGVHLRVTPVSARIVADPDRLLQCLTNLLSNAIKFSDSGSEVRLTARAVVPNLRFEVRDCGRGIPREKLQSIFEPFQQVDTSDSRLRGGTGLGLPICREIVRQHGGTLGVDSELEKGSAFHFTIPLVRQTDVAEPANTDGANVETYSMDSD